MFETCYLISIRFKTGIPFTQNYIYTKRNATVWKGVRLHTAWCMTSSSHQPDLETQECNVKLYSIVQWVAQIIDELFIITQLEWWHFNSRSNIGANVDSLFSKTYYIHTRKYEYLLLFNNYWTIDFRLCIRVIHIYVTGTYACVC